VLGEPLEILQLRSPLTVGRRDGDAARTDSKPTWVAHVCCVVTENFLSYSAPRARRPQHTDAGLWLPWPNARRSLVRSALLAGWRPIKMVAPPVCLEATERRPADHSARIAAPDGREGRKSQGPRAAWPGLLTRGISAPFSRNRPRFCLRPLHLQPRPAAGLAARSALTAAADGSRSPEPAPRAAFRGAWDGAATHRAEESRRCHFQREATQELVLARLGCAVAISQPPSWLSPMLPTPGREAANSTARCGFQQRLRSPLQQQGPVSIDGTALKAWRFTLARRFSGCEGRLMQSRPAC